MTVSMGGIYTKIYTSLKDFVSFFHLLIKSKGKTHVIAQDVVTLVHIIHGWLRLWTASRSLKSIETSLVRQNTHTPGIYVLVSL